MKKNILLLILFLLCASLFANDSGSFKLIDAQEQSKRGSGLIAGGIVMMTAGASVTFAGGMAITALFAIKAYGGLFEAIFTDNSDNLGTGITGALISFYTTIGLTALVELGGMGMLAGGIVNKVKAKRAISSLSRTSKVEITPTFGINPKNMLPAAGLRIRF